MGKKQAATSRCGLLIQFLELIKDFFCKAKQDAPAVVEAYEIDQLIHYLNNVEDTGLVNICFERISFRISTSSMNPIPKVKGNKANVCLSMKYDWNKNGSIREYPTDEERKRGCEIYDCNIEIKAIEEKGEYRKFSWHLDCEESTNGKFVHPHFHFHAGGKKISDLNTGQLLMLASPRIAYPPMDLPLAINFVIRNFVHRDEMSDQYAILHKDAYKTIVRQSELNILKPYFEEVCKKVGTEENRYFPVML